MAEYVFRKPIISKIAKKRYLLHRLKEIIACRSALSRSDWSALIRTAENLEGNAETFGFVTLSRLGCSLETIAKKKSKKKAHALLFQFENTVAEELSKF